MKTLWSPSKRPQGPVERLVLLDAAFEAMMRAQQGAPGRLAHHRQRYGNDMRVVGLQRTPGKVNRSPTTASAANPSQNDAFRA